MKEVFAKPAVGAIIEENENGEDYILIQERMKEDNILENGLLEIPAGKIREYENIFQGLRREVLEETGLTITEIEGEKDVVECKCNGYTVISFNPFYSSQNLSGVYSIMLQTFICKAKGNLLKESNESIDIRWIKLTELKELLDSNENLFYPMHINAMRKYINFKLGGSNC